MAQLISESHAVTPARGFAATAAALTIWSLMPLYWKALSHVQAEEIMLHRVMWSMLTLLLFLLAKGALKEARVVFSNRKTLLTLALTGFLIASNWYTYIYSVNANRLIESSLGYYINPLLIAFFGMIFLKEKLTRMQYVAIAIAGAGVAIQIAVFGKVPYISLYLALSFSLYSLLRKTAPVGAFTGLFVETLIIGIPVTGYLAYQAANGAGTFLHTGLSTDLLLIGAGIGTTLPLALYTVGARALKMSTLGITQYISPSIQFLLSIFLFGETFTRSMQVTFVFIWVAVIVYTYELIRTGKEEKAA